MAGPRPTPSFFKVMLGDFRTTLRIPPAFEKNLRSKPTPLESVLTASTGRQSLVRIERESGGSFLRDGWAAFVSDHSITLGDFLLFTYDGNLGFSVKIFGKNGCLKPEPPPSAQKPTPSTPGVQIPVKIERNLSCRIKKSSKRKRDSSSPGDTVIDLDQEVVWKRVRKAENSDVYCKIRRCSKVEMKSSLEAECYFNCTCPHYISTVKPTLTFPAELAREYGISKNDEVTLRDPKGVSWPVQISGWHDKRLTLGKGWFKFRKQNCLKKEDVCVFEFVGGKNIDVHFYRVKYHTYESTQESGKTQSGRKKKHGEKNIKAVHSTETNQSRFRSLSQHFARVLKEAKAFKSKYPKFVALCRHSHIYCMPIPKRQVRGLDLKTRLIRRRMIILYDPRGRRWDVEVVRRRNCRVDLSKGWNDFLRANNLCEGDACVFELIRGIDEIKVHIFPRRN